MTAAAAPRSRSGDGGELRSQGRETRRRLLEAGIAVLAERGYQRRAAAPGSGPE